MVITFILVPNTTCRVYLLCQCHQLWIGPANTASLSCGNAERILVIVLEVILKANLSRLWKQWQQGSSSSTLLIFTPMSLVVSSTQLILFQETVLALTIWTKKTMRDLVGIRESPAADNVQTLEQTIHEPISASYYLHWSDNCHYFIWILLIIS